MRIMRLLSTSIILEFIVISARCSVAKILINIFLLANNFGTDNRIKFICCNYPPFSVNQSIITKCHNIKPIAFLKRTEANSLGQSKLRANV